MPEVQQAHLVQEGLEEVTFVLTKLASSIHKTEKPENPQKSIEFAEEKRMRKNRLPFKAIACTVAVLSLFLSLVGCGAPKGFDSCESARIESIEVTEAAVRIIGGDPSVTPEGFVGYYSEEKGGKLYVGFKFGGIKGLFETADFDITIPLQGEITEVVIKTRDNEYSIWPNFDNAE